MRKNFEEYYRPSADELSKLWKDAVFIFDTNIFLDLYRHSEKTSQLLIKVFSLLKKKKQLWLPYQIGIEFHKKRVDIINELSGSYSYVKELIDSGLDDISKKIKDKFHNEHPRLDLIKIEKKLILFKKSLSQEIDDASKVHPDWLNKDEIIEKLDIIFTSTIIGKCFTNAEYSALEKEGEERFKKMIPPGFEDAKEKDLTKNRYGDLIIWKEILRFAKEKKKSVIFVTRDKKEDWWLRSGGKTILPRPELIREFSEITDKTFYMYDSEQFVKFAKEEFASLDIDEMTIKEIHDYNRKMIDNSTFERNKFLHPSGYGYFRELIRYFEQTINYIKGSNIPPETSLHLQDRLKFSIDQLIRSRVSSNEAYLLLRRFIIEISSTLRMDPEHRESYLQILRHGDLLLDSIEFRHPSHVPSRSFQEGGTLIN